MHLRYLSTLLLCLVALADIAAQASQSFETRTTTFDMTGVADNYFDSGNPAVAHELLDYLAGGAMIPVNDVTMGTNLGFRSFYRPTRVSDSSMGLQAGAGFGYVKGEAITQVVTAPFDGSQAFFAEDTDAEVTLLFDPVSLAGVSDATFSMAFAADGSMEESNGANDRFYAALAVTDCPAATTVTLVDTDGGGSGGGGGGTFYGTTTINGQNVVSDAWIPITTSLAAYTNCNVQLRIELDVNSSSEEIVIDAISFSGGITLPVEFTRFSATAGQKSVDLSWETASEDGNRGFSVERSTDAVNFRPIGWVEGAGTSASTNHYAFIDEAVIAGEQYYYRLRQEDYDGAFAYSNIAAVRLGGAAAGISSRLFPNPTYDGLTTLELSTAAAGTREVAVRDLNGRKLLSLRQSVTKGSNRLSLDLGDFPTGTYVVTVAGGAGAEVLRLLHRR